MSGKSVAGGYESLPIPEHSTWIVTMWHFGQDGSNEYTGQNFCSTWRDGQNALIRNYLKRMNSSMLTATSTTIRKRTPRISSQNISRRHRRKVYFNTKGASNYY